MIGTFLKKRKAEELRFQEMVLCLCSLGSTKTFKELYKIFTKAARALPISRIELVQKVYNVKAAPESLTETLRGMKVILDARLPKDVIVINSGYRTKEYNERITDEKRQNTSRNINQRLGSQANHHNR